MNTSKINLAPIDEPNLYGYFATRGSLKVELIRCYEGRWSIFAYINNKPIRCEYLGGDRYYSFNTGKKVLNELVSAQPDDASAVMMNA
jgi:hypothetical protein